MWVQIDWLQNHGPLGSWQDVQCSKLLGILLKDHAAIEYDLISEKYSTLIN